MSVEEKSKSWLSAAPESAARYAENSRQGKFLNDLADLYIAGPMTGLPEFNYPAFYRAEKYLTTCGLTVENPAWNVLPEGEHWIGYMRLGVSQLVRCRAIYMLNGWYNSKGAIMEFNLAKDLRMPIFFENQDTGPMIKGTL